jgi:hypothetical protein
MALGSTRSGAGRHGREAKDVRPVGAARADYWPDRDAGPAIAASGSFLLVLLLLLLLATANPPPSAPPATTPKTDPSGGQVT